MSYKKISIKDIIIIALMAAVICVLSPFSITIPISPVPISLATLAIYLTMMILGGTKGTISVIIYVFLGFIGAPVFTGFSGGVGKVLGPTGGYIIGYIFLAIISGMFIDNFRSKWMQFLGMVVGTIVLYIFGTLWLAFETSMTFKEALFAGVIPFIPGDVVKMIIALYAGTKIKNVLNKGNF